MSRPMQFRWDGEAMVPPSRFWGKACDAVFVVGEVYTLVEHQDRSSASHRHYFAAVHDAWDNLREDQQERFPSPEHLRKYALIKAGYADSRQFVASSKAEAMRLSAYIRPMDEYALVSVDGPVVTTWTARSQDMRSMGKKEFQRSKDAVLNVLAELIGTTPAALSSNAGQAA